MKKTLLILSILTLLGSVVYGQRTTFQGTVLVYGTGFNTRATTRTFTLNITGETPMHGLRSF